MADVIVNSPNPGNSSESPVGMIIGLLLIVVVVAGGIILYKKGFFNGAARDATNINVTVPNPIDNGGSSEGNPAQ